MENQTRQEKILEFIAKFKNSTDPADDIYKDSIKILEDELNIGTDKYKGLAFFHNIDYKHTCRDLSNEQLVKVHKLFIENGLVLNGKSDLHWELIKSVRDDK